MDKHEQILQRRYWFIKFDQREPSGGLKDVVESFDDIHEAEAHYAACKEMDNPFAEDVFQLWDSDRKVYLHKD